MVRDLLQEALLPLIRDLSTNTKSLKHNSYEIKKLREILGHSDNEIGLINKRMVDFTDMKR